MSDPLPDMQSHEGPAGLKVREVALALVRGLALAPVLGLVWFWVGRHLGFPRADDPLFVLYGALLGAGAAPLAVGEAWARGGWGRRLPVGLGLAAAVWFEVALYQVMYVQALMEHGSALKPLQAASSVLASTLSTPRVVFELLGAVSYAVPFALAAWGRQRGGPLRGQIARTLVGSAALGGALLLVRAASLGLTGAPSSASQVPLAVNLAALAAALPLVDAAVGVVGARAGRAPVAEPAQP